MEVEDQHETGASIPSRRRLAAQVRRQQADDATESKLTDDETLRERRLRARGVDSVRRDGRPLTIEPPTTRNSAGAGQAPPIQIDPRPQLAALERTDRVGPWAGASVHTGGALVLPNITALAAATQYQAGTVVQPSAASMFTSEIRNQPPNASTGHHNGRPPPVIQQQPRAAGATVYEESVATGAFKRVTAGTNYSYGHPSRDNRGADTTAEEAGNALRPTEPITRGAEQAIALLCKYAESLLSGLALATILAVSQFATSSEAVVGIAPFVASLRFTAYLLSMLVWLQAADEFVRYRQCVREAQAVNAAALAIRGHAKLTTHLHKHTLQAGKYVVFALVCYTIVAATVLAAMPLDNRLRMQQSTPVADVTDGTLGAFAAWKVLAIIRLAFVLLGHWCTTITVQRPRSVDLAVAAELSLERDESQELAAQGQAA